MSNFVGFTHFPIDRSLPRKSYGPDGGSDSSSEMSTPPISTVKATSSRRPPPPPPPSGEGAYPFG